MTLMCDNNDRTVSMPRKTQDAVRQFTASALAMALVALAHFLGIRLCPLQRLFSVPCPTCGTSRAVIEIARGNVSNAFAIQPLVCFVIFAGIPLAAICASAMGRRRVLNVARLLSRMPATWTALALAVAANWAYVIVRGN